MHLGVVQLSVLGNCKLLRSNICPYVVCPNLPKRLPGSSWSSYIQLHSAGGSSSRRSHEDSGMTDDGWKAKHS